VPNNVGENQAKRKLAAGELVLCMGINQMRTPNIAMIAAACGFGAIYIDLEHNPTSLETAAAICVAALGSTLAEARAVVDSCRYPPHGRRSASGSGPPLGYASRSQGEINSYLNERTLLIAMLETPEAIENADAIAAVDGIDMLHIGSSDLSTEMGIADQYKHARMREAYEATAKAARADGKSMGVGGVREDLEFQTWLMQLGMRYLTSGLDVGYILSAGRADVRRLREVRLS
jgi:2-keto-3-deoxy-L-rhamnonate aldolase RhmA